MQSRPKSHRPGIAAQSASPPGPPGPSDHSLVNALEGTIEAGLRNLDAEVARLLRNDLILRLRSAGSAAAQPVNTPYINTIPPGAEPHYPGNRELERRIKSLARWNAMAMVVNAQREEAEVGGHISSYASMATLYEVAYNHFFRGGDNKWPADLVYFQGHTSPGNYARAYLEYRLDERHLHNFRRELAEGGGLSSYPHPYLMPDFWQFPTVSMGLGPIMSIYQARFVRYLKARGLLQTEKEPRVWAFVGDGEADEPETLGALTLAAREGLDNLTWVVNCNLQRLDGPVRGNGKIIQELEGVFRGAGWHVIKVIWGSAWDELFARDDSGLLLKRMDEAVDGDFQKYTVAPGSYIRRHFFGKYPQLLRLVDPLSDDDLTRLVRGGHDPVKVYAAYKAAVEHKGGPTAILAKTVKGYGLGEAGEGRNISHQQKKMNEKELREFRARFDVPISDEDIVDTPFFRPARDSAETKYLLERRKKLGGFVPKRQVKAPPLKTPRLEAFQELLKGSGAGEASTTKSFVRLLTILARDPNIGRRVVPIIPDEARTFGIDPLFSQIGIYSSKGQLYEPVDKQAGFSFYHEAKDGQILEEGITEAGAMASFVAAGTAYANHAVNLIPFYIYYSMFGPQRVGDEFWLAGDSRTKGFLLGATSGRTTLNGEGLQHQDGHSPLTASTIPTLYVYDPAFAYEVAAIICDGMKRMFEDGEEIMYYLCLYNEGYPQPPMPPGCADGIIKGLYKFKPGPEGKKHRAHLLGSGSILRSALRAQEILAARYDVSADVWSATSYKNLRNEALLAARWNMLHPAQPARKPYLQQLLEKETGPFIAVSDYMKIVPDQIAKWVPGGLTTLGTDGFGRSESRAHLRRFFEIDAESTVIATLHTLAQRGAVSRETVAQAIRDLNIDPEKDFPKIAAF
ncbi:MAG: pyruvate dehydrogenase (acetyl-transferring), homodimeric type [Verrucomicrobiota bacterium]